MFFFYSASCVPGLCVLCGECDRGVYVSGSDDRGSWRNMFWRGGYFVSLTEDWMVAAAREKLMLIFETKSFIVEPRHSYTLSSGDK